MYAQVCKGVVGVNPIAVKIKWPHSPRSVILSLTSAQVTVDLYFGKAKKTR